MITKPGDKTGAVINWSFNALNKFSHNSLYIKGLFLRRRLDRDAVKVEKSGTNLRHHEANPIILLKHLTAILTESYKARNPQSFWQFLV